MSTAKRARRLKNRLPSVDAPMLIVTVVLVIFGLIMLMSASYAYAYYYYGDSYYYIKDQLLYALLGFAVMFVVSRVDYRILHKLAWPLMLFSYVLLALTLVMPARNGAHRWLIIGSYSFQPSELVKITLIILFAHLISVNYDRMKEFKFGYVVFMAIIAAIAAIMLNQTHLSGTIIIVLIGLVMMFVGGSKFWWFLATAAVGGGSGFAYLMFSHKMSYAMQRISTWLSPFEDTSDSGYQTYQSLLAIGSGGLFGLGLGNSRQKYLYVPEPQNDFIFSIICEELGYIGAIFVILLFVYFVVRGFSIALNAKDKFGSMMALGITTQVGLQAMLNIAVVTNAVPNTGISLPFFSQGGTSLVMLLAEVGLLLSISRYSKTEKN